ncbi:hypothetical protein [Cloacibacillus porcorum]|jgi:hypothetical protein|uniref:hypothetical protein n=1 Tax=Cloacibacillus porcorum TaxID=1197717 RepID=UPI00267282D6|nr:hypothetical protein [Cloacibacillus porcorum]
MSNAKENTAQTSVRLPVDVMREFRAICVLQGTSMQAVLSDYIYAYIEEHKKP